MAERARDCIVVGGGPAGIIFGYLAARAGLKVTLLEAAKDFNRQFRGDTLNPLTLTFLEQMGLIDQVLALPHSKVDTLRATAGGDEAVELSYKRLRTKYPYVMILSQPIFLNFLIEKASQYPNFRLEMRARVTGLIEEGGAVRGVTYKDGDGDEQSLFAPFTLGADGRASATRQTLRSENRQPDQKARRCGLVQRSYRSWRPAGGPHRPRERRQLGVHVPPTRRVADWPDLTQGRLPRVSGEGHRQPAP
jgi:2-polyprenyl-6-methoxyphenol hydroxylase-like FAD-dependent oxidoreductase